MLNEKEKQAIEYLKENALVRLNKNNKIVAYGNSYKYYILKLLDKQQKEIEELTYNNEILKKLPNSKEKYIDVLENKLFNSVSKEAIREKIKAKELQKEFAETIDDRIHLDGEIYILKELLGE